MFNFLKKDKKVVTRFAPSPTGVLHIGGVRTALFNYAFAKQNGGKFVLRIEDTDKERSKKEHEDGILESFSWLGLEHDEFYRQSDRGEVYKNKLQQLIDSGFAYEAEENKEKSGKVIRFKNPNTKVSFQDEIVGEVTFDIEELGDFVIARDISSPVYHFVVVVDDGDMGITHVIRGQEHLNSTARQLVILEALGYERPIYAHIPLIMSPTGGKLSKRDPGVKSVLEYRDAGYLKDALLNFLSFIGWNPGDDREIIPLLEFVKEFSLERVQKGGAAFNSEKLDWTNKQYIKNLSDDALLIKVSEFVSSDLFEKVRDNTTAVKMLTERIDNFGELRTQEKEGNFVYLYGQPKYEFDKLIMKKSDKETTLKHLEHIKESFSSMESFNSEDIKNSVWDYATENGRGQVLWPLRFSLSGRDRSPDPFSIAEVIGKKTSIERIDYAINMLQ
jgi:glutamyl-tRNA synthetase